MAHRVVFGRHAKDCPGCLGTDVAAPVTVKTTAHTCGGPAFGRLTAGCPRCDELSNGAAPVQWAASRRQADDADRSAAIREHFAPGGRHASGKCGSVCTAFDW